MRKLDKVLGEPKNLVEMFNDTDPVMAWYPMMVGLNSKVPIVLVEDQFSALRACSYMHSAALIGTNLSEKKVHALLRGGMRRVIIALDADATGRAAGIVTKYRSLFDMIQMLPLTKDLKDMSEDELSDLLEPLL